VLLKRRNRGNFFNKSCGNCEGKRRIGEKFFNKSCINT
jgi:hypothetical protein